MIFKSYDKDGQPRTLEETFWECVDEAQKEWDFQASLKDEDWKEEHSEVYKKAYLNQRLIIQLNTILLLRRMMKEEK